MSLWQIPCECMQARLLKSWYMYSLMNVSGIVWLLLLYCLATLYNVSGMNSDTRFWKVNPVN